MIRVGILTHYYRSLNYGGNLQAYALCKVLNTAKNVAAEQICLDFIEREDYSWKKIDIKSEYAWFRRNYRSKRKAIKRLWDDILVLIKTPFYKYLYTKFCKRDSLILDFNKNKISHSELVFTDKTIVNCVKDYDVFVVGSDQVWSGEYDPFFLTFVTSDKKKISYAASISRKCLSDLQKEYFRYKLKDFYAISVRENADKFLLDNLIGGENVAHVLDPTLLLPKLFWDDISNGRLIKKRYAFCYFLGDSKLVKNTVKQFAKKLGLKLVIIPDFKDNKNEYVTNDRQYGDYKLYDVSPADFVSLIRNAEYVFTDSFHAMAFSLIYKKQFFVFKRDGGERMNTRIESLAKLFDCEHRFCLCDDMIDSDYLSSIEGVIYEERNTKFEEMRERSIAFLENSIGCKLDL